MTVILDDVARARLLVTTDWLAAHHDDPAVRVVDMRGYVRSTLVAPGVRDAAYTGAEADYIQGHIPSALYLDWTRDIVDLDDPTPVQVASSEKLEAELGRRGIGDEHLVVAYDAHPSAQFATRLWWVLRYYGHERVVVLDGGLPKWLREGRPLTVDIPTYPPARFTPHPQQEWRTTGEAMLSSLESPGVRLVDARDPEQFNGSERRGDGRPGRVPGAVNIPREAMVDPTTGVFRATQELRDTFAAAGVRKDDRVVVYCNGGIAATSVLFGLALAGHESLSNYDGSWNEWGARTEWPVEMGASLS